MPAIAEPVHTASTAIVIPVDVSGATGAFTSAVLTSGSDDYLVEAPMEFVDGLVAKPSREPQEEPAGSGPFGF